MSETIDRLRERVIKRLRADVELVERLDAIMLLEDGLPYYAREKFYRFVLELDKWHLLELADYSTKAARKTITVTLTISCNTVFDAWLLAVWANGAGSERLAFWMDKALEESKSDGVKVESIKAV